MDDLHELLRRKQARSPILGGAATLLGFAVAQALPINANDRIVFAVGCGGSFFIADVAHILWAALSAAHERAQQLKDEEWARLVNASTRSQDAAPESN